MSSQGQKRGYGQNGGGNIDRSNRGRRASSRELLSPSPERDPSPLTAPVQRAVVRRPSAVVPVFRNNLPSRGFSQVPQATRDNGLSQRGPGAPMGTHAGFGGSFQASKVRKTNRSGRRPLADITPAFEEEDEDEEGLRTPPQPTAKSLGKRKMVRFESEPTEESRLARGPATGGRYGSMHDDKDLDEQTEAAIQNSIDTAAEENAAREAEKDSDY